MSFFKDELWFVAGCRSVMCIHSAVEGRAGNLGFEGFDEIFWGISNLPLCMLWVLGKICIIMGYYAKWSEQIRKLQSLFWSLDTNSETYFLCNE